MSLKVLLPSIAGDFRKGKSFLLNFMVRYLEAGGDPGWLDSGDKATPLEGFSWRQVCPGKDKMGRRRGIQKKGCRKRSGSRILPNQT
jgi:hypothetical protein